MAEKAHKLPGPDHPMAIEPHHGRILVRAGGQVIADTKVAQTLREASYRPVFYLPRADVNMALLQRTDHATHCPYKGDCSYYSIPSGGPKAVNAVWSYEDPYPAAAAIRGYVAVYPDRVDSIDEVAA